MRIYHVPILLTDCIPIGKSRNLALLAPGGLKVQRDSKVSIAIDVLSAPREQRTQSVTMSLNIPHREKHSGSAAATKAVILVRSLGTKRVFS